ncbi:MAG: hypothetical protein L6R42_001714 [Xanthoria sp. 1 TBL-2021]|nr:MAG: hypothetical protein L6R42_001714 [Xanthoria sp. 1 TBL-2021]
MKVESEEQSHPRMSTVESTIEDNSGPSERPAGYTQPRKKRRLDHDGALPDHDSSIRNEVTESRTNGESSYILSRHYAATTRLNSQHLLWKLELGWCLHPSLQALISTALPIVTALPQVPAPTITSSTQQLNPLAAAHQNTFRVADLATGTAIWAVDISQDFPLAQIDRFDIDLQQCPPPKWLPHNVKGREWEIYTELTPELQGLYDVVHIRLLLLVIRDNDPRPILKNALRMLKKGGYLQWDELDPWGAFTVVASKQMKDEYGQRVPEATGIDGHEHFGVGDGTFIP